MTSRSEVSMVGCMLATCCHHFNTSYCRSCTALGWDLPNHSISERKADLLLQVLRPWVERTTEIEPVALTESPLPSRAKVKAAVTGTSQNPIVGIIDADFQGKNLLDCPLHLPPLNSILVTTKELVSEFGIEPYDIVRRTGELKHIIATTNRHGDQNIVRFVLRSETQREAVVNVFIELQRRFPSIRVASINIQPLPAAILEGPTEARLSEESVIWEDYGGTQVAFGSQSFIQVTPHVATLLYQYARSILEQLRPVIFCDLFCGTGAFSLVSRGTWSQHIGIEISENAVQCARMGADRNGASDCRFEIGDATKFANDLLEKPDVVLVNPPRRGLGDKLCNTLATAAPEYLLYSSCNPSSLARDLNALHSLYTLVKIKPFDMFPLTEHIEGFCVLRRR